MRIQNKLKIIITTVVLSAFFLIITFVFEPRRDDEIAAGFTAEFIERPDGYTGLCEAYNFTFQSPPVQMDPGLMYKSVAEGAVDVICAFATDGRIEAYNLVTLKDDRGYFPPYYAAPLVRKDTLKRYPRLKKILNGLHNKISNDEMRDLNYRVDRDIDPVRAREAARNFLVEKGIIPEGAGNEKSGSANILVGGKDFTEQSILGEIISIVIESKTDITVERKLYLGGTMICFNALQAGDLDIYAEYTGTGLVNILNRKVMNDPDDVYKAVKREFSARYDLAWLKPFGFNNTYTLAVRRGFAEKQGLATISDLAAHIKSSKQRITPQR